MNRRRRILIPLLAIAFIAIVAPVALLIARHHSYRRQVDRGMELLQSLRQRRPAETSVGTWECAVSWTGVAYPNVFFTRNYTPHEELIRFNCDLKDRMDEEVSLETIEWFWERLSAAGPNGSRYVSRFRPQYRSMMADIEERANNQMQNIGTNAPNSDL